MHALLRKGILAAPKQTRSTKTIINKIKDFYSHGDVAFYVSLLGPLTMGTIHLVFAIIQFDWIVTNYCIFYSLMVLSKVWQWAIEKYNLKPNAYIAGTISISMILAPMMAAFVLTILYKDAPRYFWDWLVYAYASYGTLKMIFAIRSLTKKNRTDKQFVLSFLGLLGALYTMQMMEFSLITTFSEPNYAMYLMQLFTQGAIFLFSLFVVGLFVFKAVALKREQSK